MFNIGPMEFLVLAIVGLVVVGPEKLPQFAKDAARLIRQLRDMATGARQQLRDELGPEFADVDLSTLNPRTAVQRAVFGDDVPDLGKYNPRNYNPSSIVRNAIFAEDEPKEDTAVAADDADSPISLDKPRANGARPRPRPRPGPGRTNYDDAT